MNTTRPRSQKTHPSALPTSIAPSQDGLPLAQGGAGAELTPDVPTDVQAASNGRASGAAAPVADAANPEVDPFDLDSLRLPQDFASAVGVKKLITTIPVRKPSKEWFIRVHHNPGYRLQVAVLELKEDREIYLVDKSLRNSLTSEPTLRCVELVTAINRQDVLFVWPIKLPGSDGRIDDWSRSAMAAADEAKTQWVRVTANMSLGAYDVAVASGQVAEPSWPAMTFQEILRAAFRDKVIADWDHPVLRRLRGEA